MTKLVLSIVFASFALALQAGSDSSCCDKDSTSCCSKPKAEVTKADSKTSKQAKATCSDTVKTSAKVSKPVLQSPKAFADAR